MVKKWTIAALAAVSIVAVAPAVAGNKLIAAGERVTVAKSKLAVAPAVEWNKLGARPGRNAETWTIDGDQLNDVTFYGGIPEGQTLFREVSKRDKPLPRMSATMLVTDIPTMLENSYRIALNTAQMKIDTVEPAPFAGAKGVRFTYSFVRADEDLVRRGEARAAVIGGKLYMITYEAPELHFFERGIDSFRQIADSATM